MESFRRKCSLRGIPRFMEESILKLGREGSGMKKLVLQKILLQQTELSSCFFVRDMLRNGIPKVCFSFCFTELNSELLSLTRNGSEQNSKCLLLFAPRNRIPSCVLSAEWFRTEFREFASTLFQGREFGAFSPLRNGSEWNSESFLFRGTAGIPPEQTNYSVYSIFRGIIFMSEIANPSRRSSGRGAEPYDCKKAWASKNCSILSGTGPNVF